MLLKKVLTENLQEYGFYQQNEPVEVLMKAFYDLKLYQDIWVPSKHSMHNEYGLIDSNCDFIHSVKLNGINTLLRYNKILAPGKLN